MEVSGHFHFPSALLHGKSPRYALNRRLGGSQNPLDTVFETNSQPLPVVEPWSPYRPVRSLVAIPTELVFRYEDFK
jgi:hypothetical protein